MSADIFRIVNAQNYKIDSLDSGLDALERMFDDLDRAGYKHLARELSDVLKQARVCDREAREELEEDRRYEIEDLNYTIRENEEENAKLKEEVERLTKTVEDLEGRLQDLEDERAELISDLAEAREAEGSES